MAEPGAAAREIASRIKYSVRDTTLGVHMRQYSDDEELIAEAIQAMADEGYIYGIVATGDHEVLGETVITWSKLEPSRE